MCFIAGQQLNTTFVSFDELLDRSDFVIVSCPLNDETRNLFDKKAFSKMKKSSVFVNVARGGIVVQNDLVDALQNGTIFAAGLDVMVPEPIPADDILTKLPNCGESIFFVCVCSITRYTKFIFVFVFCYCGCMCYVYSAHPTFGISCCSNPR